jgi:DNA-binding response OmpR family regulator
MENPTHVIVVDDSPTTCKILEITLKRAGGFTITCFTDPVKALVALEGHTVPLPDLLLLDVLLPRMDGFEVMCYLSKHEDLKDITVILMSRKDRTIDRLKARLAGAACYITKPFDTQEVVRVVREQCPLLTCTSGQPARANAGSMDGREGSNE